MADDRAADFLADADGFRFSDSIDADMRLATTSVCLSIDDAM